MKKIVAAALAATLVSGCQSIFGHHAKLEVRPIGAESTAASATIALEEGRQSLMRGNVASAIVELKMAELDPDTAAAAHNGLGAAYAMLGRGDLAERYFQQATAEDPTESKYSSNLAKFYRSREAVLARLPSDQPQLLKAQANAETQETVALEPAEHVIRTGAISVRVAASTQAAAMTRVSANEVSIRTTSPAIGPTLANGRRQNPRFSSANLSPRRQAYPIRIELGR